MEPKKKLRRDRCAPVSATHGSLQFARHSQLFYRGQCYSAPGWFCARSWECSSRAERPHEKMIFQSCFTAMRRNAQHATESKRVRGHRFSSDGCCCGCWRVKVVGCIVAGCLLAAAHHRRACQRLLLLLLLLLLLAFAVAADRRPA